MWKNDIVDWLKLIQSFCYKHGQDSNNYYAIFNSFEAQFINFQKNDHTNDDYLKGLQGWIAMLEDYYANAVNLAPCLMKCVK